MIRLDCSSPETALRSLAALFDSGESELTARLLAYDNTTLSGMLRERPFDECVAQTVLGPTLNDLAFPQQVV